MMKHLLSMLFLLAVVALLSPARASAVTASAGGTLVVADPADPYRVLGEEIARAEGVPLVESMAVALERDSDYVLWVVAPDNLSERALIDLGTALRGRTSTVGVGIISGSTIDAARALWLRAREPRSARAVSANAANPSVHIPERLLRWDGAVATAEPYSKPAVLDALRTAGYFAFTGHGGRKYLRLDEWTTIGAADLPDLPPLVVATASCQTFQPWVEDSIALTFVDRGAAAYAGFAYSPNEGYLLGEFDGLPFRYTWPGFTAGDVIQVQNRGTLLGFAAFPHYFMLGDPRIALASAAPYQLVDDRTESGVRTLSYTGAPAGIIPVRIPDGAAYAFVEIPGVAAVSAGAPFYNGRLQFANHGADKLVLFAHRGGDFQVRLQPAAPAGWVIGDAMVDSLDETLIFSVVHGEGVGLVAAVPMLPAGAWLARRRGLPARSLVAAVLAGLAIAGLHALYMAARASEVTITSKPMAFSVLGVAVTGLLACGGALLWGAARSWRGRALAVLGATFPAWAAAALGLAVSALLNFLFAQRGLGPALYNYALGLAALPGLAVEILAFVAVFLIAGQVAGGRQRARRSPTWRPEPLPEIGG